MPYSRGRWEITALVLHPQMLLLKPPPPLVRVPTQPGPDLGPVNDCTGSIHRTEAINCSVVVLGHLKPFDLDVMWILNCFNCLKNNTGESRAWGLDAKNDWIGVGGVGGRNSDGLYPSLSMKSFTRERGFKKRERGEEKEGERAAGLPQCINKEVGSWVVRAAVWVYWQSGREVERL